MSKSMKPNKRALQLEYTDELDFDLVQNDTSDSGCERDSEHKNDVEDGHSHKNETQLSNGLMTQVSNNKNNERKVNEPMKDESLIKDVEEHEVEKKSDVASGRFLASSSSRLVFDGDEEDESLEKDIYTLMMLTKLNSKAWKAGIVAFSLQITLCLLILFNFLETDSDIPFGIPVKVPPSVRVGQFICILLSLMMQTDLIASIKCIVVLNRDMGWEEIIDERGNKTIGLWLRRIFLPNLFKLVVSIFVLFLSMVIILQSDNILDLIKDFATLFLISEIDNIMFLCADRGFLGEAIATEAANLKGFMIPRFAFNFSRVALRYCILACIFIGMIVSWSIVYKKQESGAFFAVEFPRCVVTNDFKAKVGNGQCDGGFLNSVECDFDGKDCVEFNLAYPDCRALEPFRVGDDVCDEDNNNQECGFDGGDCCPFQRNDDRFFNGLCDGGYYNTKACGYDNGDCDEFNSLHPECPIEILASKVNEEGEVPLPAVCIEGGPYALAECGCTTRWSDIFPKCNENEEDFYAVIDGVCEAPGEDYFYELEEGKDNRRNCGFEGGDCFSEAYPNCTVDNLADLTKFADGNCDEMFNSVECDWDFFDCGEFFI